MVDTAPGLLYILPMMKHKHDMRKDNHGIPCETCDVRFHHAYVRGCGECASYHCEDCILTHLCDGWWVAMQDAFRFLGEAVEAA